MSGAIIDPDAVPYSWARKELILDKPLQHGDEGGQVKNCQEWLCLHGHRLVVDGDFGDATEAAVRQFQRARNLADTGIVEGLTFRELILPMLRVLTPPEQYDSYHDLVVKCAHNHLKEHPREVGGANRGPWVRLYMKGNQGSAYLWCAGFACFILRQAADIMQVPMPLKYTFSCDDLAAQAKARGLFISGKDLAQGNPPKKDMPPGSIFLRRRSAQDWEHTGLVVRFEESIYQTIEGNTNDDGAAEGYEVCTRLQGYRNKDFIKIV